MIPTHDDCPVCGSTTLQPTVQRVGLPTMQNRVFRTMGEARAAKSGLLDLELCQTCGFVFNNQFDPSLLVYDQDYDNSIPSTVVDDYYRQVASHLHQRYLLREDALVVEIGCGKGVFLKSLCQMFPGVRGIGIDPSYEGPLEEPGLPVRFIRDFFGSNQLAERPDLIVCRHILEHIPQPIEFLRSIAAPLQQFSGVPIFVEVPDLRWIVRQQAFWDFCYEHCNYFTSDSLNLGFLQAGFQPIHSTTGFGSQYLWQEAIIASSETAIGLTNQRASVHELSESLSRYCDLELARVTRMRGVLSTVKEQGWTIAIWGMATKGILFSTLVDPDSTLIDHCIDVNPAKQGRFVPNTGRLISPPERLTELRDQQLMVLVMNPNYLREIQSTCESLHLSCRFMDAQGEEMRSSALRQAA